MYDMGGHIRGAFGPFCINGGFICIIDVYTTRIKSPVFFFFKSTRGEVAELYKDAMGLLLLLSF